MQDRYELHEEIGRGAGGVIHRATDHDLRRQVAIKRLERHGSSRLQRLRFVTEAQVPAQLAHPNIIPVHDLGKTPSGDLFYVMKLVQGFTLKERISQGARRDQVLDWLEQVCRGLGFAHHQGVLHRDIKPSNIIISVAGSVKVLDFGTARAEFGERGAHTSALTLGSPLYMAPECFDGAEADPTVDIYALGSTLFELLAGVPLGRLSVHPEKHGVKLQERLAQLSSPELVEGGPILKAVRNLIGRCMR